MQRQRPVPSLPRFTPASALGEAFASVASGVRNVTYDVGLSDERRCLPPSLVAQAAQSGLLGLEAPIEVGGKALTRTQSLGVMDMLASKDCTLAIFAAVQNYLGVLPVQQFGTAQQLDVVLPKLCRSTLGALGATEPVAGSNASGFQTTLTEVGAGEYRLDGQKSWISMGSWAGYINVMAKFVTRDGRQHGLTGVLVDCSLPGFQVDDEILTMGLRSLPQANLSFHGVRVGSADLLADPGDGSKILTEAFNGSRMAVAAIAAGAMRRCMRISSGYVATRRVGGGYLRNKLAAKELLSDCLTAMVVVEAVLAKAVRATEPDIEAMIAKTLAAELCWSTVDACTQLLGGRGFAETNVVAKYLRDCRVFRIFDGPTETLVSYIGARLSHDTDLFWRVVGRDGEAMETTAISELTTNCRRGTGDARSRSAASLAYACMWSYAGEAVTHYPDEELRVRAERVCRAAFEACFEANGKMAPFDDPVALVQDLTAGLDDLDHTGYPYQVTSDV